MHGEPVAAVADGLAQQTLLDDDGVVVDPLFVVDLDSPATEATLTAASRAARSCGRVLVGVTTRGLTVARRELAAALDLTVVPPGGATDRVLVSCPDPQAEALALADTARAHPQATLTLKQVLRATERLDTMGALALESFAYSTLLGGDEFAAWLSRRGPRPLPPATPEPPVLLDRNGSRFHISLNRPERRNAYSRELRDALVDALRAAELDDTIAQVILDGTGPTFCSGGDLDEFGTTPDPVTAHLVRTHAGAGQLLQRLADRTEVRMHGGCVGAGVELPAFAGRVIAHPHTTFRLPEISMGLIPGAGGTAALPRRIGPWRTLWLALSGKPLDAPTAQDWSLVDTIQD